MDPQEDLDGNQIQPESPGDPVRDTSPAGAPAVGAENYVLGAEIARGGMGYILEAEDTKLKRTVAAKLMIFDSETDEGMKQRFLREAEVLARLEHPNIVPIHDIVWEGGVPLFYTMKRVNGRTLQAILRDLRNEGGSGVPPEGAKTSGGTPEPHFTLDRLLLVFRKVCDAMACAHSKGIIHRDLKPDNIMIGEFGEVLVMDWGLAKMLGGTRSRASPSAVSEQAHAGADQGRAGARPSGEDSSATLEGAVMGTPKYMSPEQARGEIDSLDERSDLFSLGGILYAILTLRAPIEGRKLDEILKKVIAGEITSPSAFGATAAKGKPVAKGEVLDAKAVRPLPHVPGGRVPAALSAVVMKALRLDKAERYQTVAEFSADVEKYQAGFATSAEQAGLGTQLLLLVRRHRGIFTTAAAAWLLITVLGVWFIINLRAKEQRALAGEDAALVEKEATRRALAVSQVALAEAAFRSADLPGMVQALDAVPSNLRDQRWDYLAAKRDSSLGEFHVEGLRKLKAIVAIPGHAAQFALADGRGVVLIVNAQTGETLRSIITDLRGDVALAITADGSRLAVTEPGASAIHFFRVADGKRDGSVPAPGSSVKNLTFSPDGSLLAVLDRSPKQGRLFLVEARAGAVLWTVRDIFDETLFSPDGLRLFAGGGLKRQFAVFGVEKGNLIREQAVNFRCMAMSRDGHRLALGLHQGETVLIDVATGLETQRARLHRSAVSGLAWAAGNQLISVGGEGEEGRGRSVMRLWEPEGFLARGTFFGIEGGPGGAGWDFDPASGYLLMGGNPPRRWRIPAGIEAARFTGRAERGWATSFVSDTLLLARKDFALAPFDVTNPRAPKELPKAGSRGYAAVASCWPGGLVALAKRIGEGPWSIKICRTDAGGLVETRDIPAPGRIAEMDWDAPGERLLAVGVKGDTLIFDARTGETRSKLPQEIKQAVFAGAGGYIAAIISRKSDADDVQDDLALIDAQSGQVLKRVPFRQRLNALAVSPDRRLVAIGGADMIVRVLDAETLEERFSYRAHDAEISALAFHPQRPVLATGSADGSVKLWEYATAHLRDSFLGFTGAPVSLAFSPNGRLLAVESVEPTARLFDLSEE